jgi:hypothetical protein
MQSALYLYRPLLLILVEDADSIFPISVLFHNRIGRLPLEIIEGKVLHGRASIGLAVLRDFMGTKVARWAGAVTHWRGWPG